MKIGQQLNIVVYACAALTLVTLLITVELFQKQSQTQVRLDRIVAVHSQIDSLRGRLWLYRQYPVRKPAKMYINQPMRCGLSYPVTSMRFLPSQCSL
jgi:hypothetical protein